MQGRWAASAMSADEAAPWRRAGILARAAARQPPAQAERRSRIDDFDRRSINKAVNDGTDHRGIDQCVAQRTAGQQVPRGISCRVSSPTWRVNRVARKRRPVIGALKLHRGGRVARVHADGAGSSDSKPQVLWLPSQNGLLPDSPHRHNAMAGFAESSENERPCESTSLKGPSTTNGPLGRVRIVTSDIVGFQFPEIWSFVEC